MRSIACLLFGQGKRFAATKKIAIAIALPWGGETSTDSATAVPEQADPSFDGSRRGTGSDLKGSAVEMAVEVVEVPINYRCQHCRYPNVIHLNIDNLQTDSFIERNLYRNISIFEYFNEQTRLVILAPKIQLATAANFLGFRVPTHKISRIKTTIPAPQNRSTVSIPT